MWEGLRQYQNSTCSSSGSLFLFQSLSGPSFITLANVTANSSWRGTEYQLQNLMISAGDTSTQLHLTGKYFELFSSPSCPVKNWWSSAPSSFPHLTFLGKKYELCRDKRKIWPLLNCPLNYMWKREEEGLSTESKHNEAPPISVTRRSTKPLPVLADALCKIQL